MAGEDGTLLGIIDWEDAVSSIGPHWDVSIALHDLPIDGKEAFLLGYGFQQSEIRAYAPVWRLFNILNYVPSVRVLYVDGDMANLDRLRTRLGGSLTLYG